MPYGWICPYSKCINLVPNSLFYSCGSDYYETGKKSIEGGPVDERKIMKETHEGKSSCRQPDCLKGQEVRSANE